MKKKIVIIAGGDGGIGFQCVKTFLKADYKVIVLDKKNLNKKFFNKNNVTYLKNNLDNEKSIQVICSKIKKKEGHVDVLLNCIGIFS